jgi:hypothetical protein
MSRRSQEGRTSIIHPSAFILQSFVRTYIAAPDEASRLKRSIVTALRAGFPESDLSPSRQTAIKAYWDKKKNLLSAIRQLSNLSLYSLT